jgi:thioredoxin
MANAPFSMAGIIFDNKAEKPVWGGIGRGFTIQYSFLRPQQKNTNVIFVTSTERLNLHFCSCKSYPMTIHLTAAEFKARVFNYETEEQWKYEGTVPAIVDFYADWCGPCKMVAPVLEELSNEYADKLVIYKVDTEKEQELAAIFDVRSIPTFLFIPMTGKPMLQPGAFPKSVFKQVIEERLLAGQKAAGDII